MKTVLITGANRGLGHSLLNCFTDAGWNVLATCRKPDLLDQTDRVTPLALDLSDYASIQHLAEKIQEKELTIDLLINNAGYNPKDSDDKDYFQSTFKIDHFSGQNISKSLHINALAPMELISKLLPHLSEAAVILNISSWLGSIHQKSSGGHYAYAGSKSLLNMFTKALGLEFMDSQRSAVALNPGWMKTDMGGSKGQHSPDDVAQSIKLLYDEGTLNAKNSAFLNIDGSEHPW